MLYCVHVIPRNIIVISESSGLNEERNIFNASNRLRYEDKRALYLLFYSIALRTFSLSNLPIKECL